jgi:hypothetical protein
MNFKKYLLFLLLLTYTSAKAQDSLASTPLIMADGFVHRVLSASPHGTPVAHLFTMIEDPQCKVSFVSRLLFKGEFSYDAVEAECRQKGQQIVLQAAAAFTPDWLVIEGFALQQGRSVGQDSTLGQNTALTYSGILCIKDGKPFFTHLDHISDRQLFVDELKAENGSLFLQAAPIVDGRLDTTLILPRSNKRRFFVEIDSDKKEFGVITFVHRTTYLEAVLFMKDLQTQGLKIKNAVYMDMGAVSEGYVYDNAGGKYLIGNGGTHMQNYTNLLVMYREQ